MHIMINQLLYLFLNAVSKHLNVSNVMIIIVKIIKQFLQIRLKDIVQNVKK